MGPRECCPRSHRGREGEQLSEGGAGGARGAPCRLAGQQARSFHGQAVKEGSARTESAAPAL